MGACASQASQVSPEPVNDPPLPVVAGASGELQNGTIVIHGHDRYRVQYVTFSRKLDLRSDDGKVLYGIDAANVTFGGSPALDPPSASVQLHQVPVAEALPEPTSTALIERFGKPLFKPQGSGASVFRCFLDGDTAEVRVAKLLPADIYKAKQQDFLEEIRICRELTHERIVRFDLLAEAIDVDGSRYAAIVMEHVPVTLAHLLNVRRACTPPRNLSVGRMAALLANLASALHYLHKECELAPVLHRDVKPLNLCVSAAPTDGSPISCPLASLLIMLPRSLPRSPSSRRVCMLMRRVRLCLRTLDSA